MTFVLIAIAMIVVAAAPAIRWYHTLQIDYPQCIAKTVWNLAQARAIGVLYRQSLVTRSSVMAS